MISRDLEGVPKWLARLHRHSAVSKTMTNWMPNPHGQFLNPIQTDFVDLGIRAPLRWGPITNELLL